MQRSGWTKTLKPVICRCLCLFFCAGWSSNGRISTASHLQAKGLGASTLGACGKEAAPDSICPHGYCSSSASSHASLFYSQALYPLPRLCTHRMEEQCLQTTSLASDLLFLWRCLELPGPESFKSSPLSLFWPPSLHQSTGIGLSYLQLSFSRF